MSKKQFSLIVTVAVFSGLVGGGLTSWLLMTQLVMAQDSPPKVIQAQEFQVVDDVGRVRIRLGFGTFDDSGDGEETHLLFLDETGVEHVMIRDTFGGPYLQLQKSTTSGSISLGSTLAGKPVLKMMDRRFGGGGINLELSPEGLPNITLFDQDTSSRAIFGTTELKHPNTGSTEIRAVSSLVLFDEEGKVVWSAP